MTLYIYSIIFLLMFVSNDIYMYMFYTIIKDINKFI